MSNENERMQILARIESGEISVNQGLELLNALENSTATGQPVETSLPGGEDLPFDLEDQVQVPSGEEPASVTAPGVQPAEPEEVQVEGIQVEQPEPTAASIDPDLERWKSFWWIPLWVGIGITVLGGLFMYLALQASGFGFWFACAWFPFLLGILILAFTWASRHMRWLHVRIQQKPGEWPQRISISFPLPLSAIAWLLRTFGNRIPNMENMDLDQMILALEHTTPEAPFYVDVDQDGDHVQVFIG